jgi:RNA polymerase primary sigma factor
MNSRMSERRGESTGATSRPATGSSRRSSRELSSERALLRAARHGDRRARQRVVVAHLPLIKSVASRYRDLGLPFEDLVQEGSLGLLDAIDRFDPLRGVDFRAFARFRVRRSIQNALTREARLVRYPKQVLERRRAVARAEARFFAANGRMPAASELASETGLSVTSVVNAREPTLTIISLDAPQPTNDSTLQTVVADPLAHDPEIEAITAEERRLVDEAVERLPKRARKVITQHFGLGTPEKPVADIAAELRLSQRRTRTIEHDALCELREHLDPGQTR